MLDYENQMLLDLMEEDGLLIMARGLGMERVLQGLIAAYNEPGNLVLIVGASVQDAQYITDELESNSNLGAPTPSRPPRIVTAEVTVADRSAVYLEGGVLFVSSRILVVDMLMERLPTHLVTGIIVWKAHKILESCQEAFILRLYRQRNKTGFIKALSNNAVSFTQGFCHVGRVMKNLFVRRLYLYPRFQLTVTETLARRKPEVVELHLRMTPAMLAIQSSVVDLVAATVHELRLANKGLIDNDILTTECALSPVLERVVVTVLQPVWQELSTRTRHLVGDLRLLRTLNTYLSQYDCVTFYNLTSSLRTTERALQSSGWMMLPPAETLFLKSKHRVFGENPTVISDMKNKNTSNKGNQEGEENPLGLSLEVNPKWECLSEVLEEVRDSARQTTGPLPERCLIVSHDDTTAHQLQQVLVDGPERVLQKLFYQTIGAKMNLTPPAHLFSTPDDTETKRKKRVRKKRPMPTKDAQDEDSAKKMKLFGIISQDASTSKTNDDTDNVNSTSDDRAESSNKIKNANDSNSNKISDGGPDNRGDAAATEAAQNVVDNNTTDAASVPAVCPAESSGPLGSSAAVSAESSAAVPAKSSAAVPTGGSEGLQDGQEKEKLDETITLTQIHEKYRFVGESSDSESQDDEDEQHKEKRREAKILKKEKLKKKEEEKKIRKNLFSSPLILVQSLKNYSDPFALPRTLRELQPRYIILYDCDLDFIRQVEVWQAECAPHQCLVYLMLYKGTTEEQLYLSQVKREKDAFHYLITEKASLVFPEHAEGRTDDHPDLQRDPRCAADRLETNADTRRGGPTDQEQQESRVIVDMREFRSELPALIHKRGIEIDPVTIEVGDYILSPEMCVERKSLSDLVGSLNSGRLYSQAVSMTRHYTKPILLIEFDQNKPFHLQASVLSNSRGASQFGTLNQGEPDNRDVTAKLQLLTLHFPRLRLLWCSSPYATAEIFHLLKTGKAEPDVTTAQAIKSDSCSIDELEKYNPIIHDFISKLPGITTKNINCILRNVHDLPTLLTLSQSAITDLLGNSVQAAQLYAALHATLRQEDIEQDVSRAKVKGKLTRKGLPKFANK